MRLVFATRDLALAGRSFEGFPLLIAENGWPAEPAQGFLWHTLVESGENLSKLTWESYGRRLFDYFSFLEANGLSWDDKASSSGLSVLSRYRDWSVGELGLSPSTINKRLGIILKLYRWAKSKGLISALPYGLKKIVAAPHFGLFAHLSPSLGVRMKPTVAVRERSLPLKFLTKEQVKECLAIQADPSHELLFNLMVRTGMRSCEARSFPLKYVFNPVFKKGITKGGMISVDMSPQDMLIKYNRPRSIDIPYSLMEKMWSYTLHQRELRRAKGDQESSALILTNEGRGYTKDSVVDAMRSYEQKCGFYVRAHMLRHTYATHTLRALRSIEGFKGEPLLYVRDRMGHADVKTTMIYLHLINQLEAQSALAHEDEIDGMFSEQGTNERNGFNQ